MKKRVLITVLVFIILCGIIGGIVGLVKSEHQTTPSLNPTPPAKSERPKIKRPLVMVPGSGGTADSYDQLIKQIKTKHVGVEVLKLTVDSKSQVTSQGTLKAKTKYPIIVIAFADSSDQAVPKQGDWLGVALRYAQKYYNFRKFNYLGHSNGGLIITYYFEDHLQKTDPSANRLLFLGAPFNGINSQENELNADQKLQTISADLKPLLAKKDQIPHQLKIKNVYSEVSNHSDGVVPSESVKSGKLIYSHVQSYQTQKLTTKVDHVFLPDSEEVFEIIEDFLAN